MSGEVAMAPEPDSEDTIAASFLSLGPRRRARPRDPGRQQGRPRGRGSEAGHPGGGKRPGYQVWLRFSRDVGGAQVPNCQSLIMIKNDNGIRVILEKQK